MRVESKNDNTVCEVAMYVGVMYRQPKVGEERNLYSGKVLLDVAKASVTCIKIPRETIKTVQTEMQIEIPTVLPSAS